MGDKFQLSYKPVVAAYNMHDAGMQSKLSFALCSLGAHNEPIKSLRVQINEVIQSSFHLSPRRAKTSSRFNILCACCSRYLIMFICSCKYRGPCSQATPPIFLYITSGSGLGTRLSLSMTLKPYIPHGYNYLQVQILTD